MLFIDFRASKEDLKYEIQLKGEGFKCPVWMDRPGARP